MSEFVDLMLFPFITCLILTGMHAYLGLHVIERGVIFVDLALAQIAAFGATVAFLFGLGLHSAGSYLLALLFTFFGAAVFALTRTREAVLPQEAVIGVVYAVCAAASVLILSQAPEGGEELKSLLVGHLLFVDWSEIRKIALLYALVALLHWMVRVPFLSITHNPQGAYAQGYRVRWWDFLFYATFGVVVTSSVEIAGVLLVFAFLVVPSLCAILLAQSIRNRLLIAWATGTVVSLLGMSASFWLDLPTGATVVCIFGLALFLIGVIHFSRTASVRRLTQVSDPRSSSMRISHT